MGLHGSLTVTLNFDNAVIPARQLLGKEGKGFKMALSNLDTGRIGIAAQALGIAEGALSEAIEFLKIRYPDGELYKNGQGLAFMLADMAARTEAARLLVYQAASLKQQGVQTGKAASMAKLFASETAMYVAGEAVQLLGDLDIQRISALNDISGMRKCVKFMRAQARSSGSSSVSIYKGGKE